MLPGSIDLRDISPTFCRAQAMDAWVVLEVESPKSVYEWREEAEAMMRAAGKPAMTQDQVPYFCLKFLFF